MSAMPTAPRARGPWLSEPRGGTGRRPSPRAPWPGKATSLIASARLHALDPEAYLRDLLGVLPFWPRDRFLELAPKLWPRTRARLDPVELAVDLGPLTVPPSINPPAEQEPSAQS